LPKNFIIREIGVTIRKKIMPIIIGEINDPNNNPNLNHILFNGVKYFELSIPSSKKIDEIIKNK
jgi:hypothetical protein